MFKRTKYILLILVLTTSCSTKSKNDVEEPRLNEIILIKSTGERCAVGQLINSLMKCSPKLIGVNYLYVGKKSDDCDTLLRNAIGRSKKVILAEGFREGGYVSSDNDFREVAMFSSPTGLAGLEDGVADSYYRISDHDGRWRYTFPFHVALQFDKRKAPQLASKSLPKDYPIKFYKTLEDFKVYTQADIENHCSEIAGKIILIGELQTDEDIIKTHTTAKSSDKTFGTVIIANIIFDILKDLDTEDVPINKYAEFIRKKEMKEN
jgi:hypothetical protein